MLFIFPLGFEGERVNYVTLLLAFVNMGVYANFFSAAILECTSGGEQSRTRAGVASPGRPATIPAMRGPRPPGLDRRAS